MQGNWYNPQGFFAFFDNEGFIVGADSFNQKRVGVTLAKYNQMEKMANEAMGVAEQHKAKEEEYKQILIEKGWIPQELTQDEKISVLSSQVDQLTQLVSQLVSKEQAQQKRAKAVTPEILPPEKERGK